MAITHTDTDIANLKINKFSSLADFQAAQNQGLIGSDEISLVTEMIQANWNETDPSSEAYIRNKPAVLANSDFTHVADTGTEVSSTVTITYANGTRGSQMISADADVSITFAVNNNTDNYLWIKNTGSSDIDITIYAVTHNSTSVSNVYVPDDGITIPAGKVCEIGIVCNADGAFITSRSDLSL